MKPKEVLKLLNCSYTTLNNYVKKGKLKYSESSGKRHDYDDSSVLIDKLQLRPYEAIMYRIK